MKSNDIVPIKKLGLSSWFSVKANETVLNNFSPYLFKNFILLLNLGFYTVFITNIPIDKTANPYWKTIALKGYIIVGMQYNLLKIWGLLVFKNRLKDDEVKELVY